MAENEAASEQTEEATTAEVGQGGVTAHADDAATATAELPQAFDKADLQQFKDDDVAAGGTICKMLCLLFVYTLIVMSYVAYWTWNAASN